MWLNSFFSKAKKNECEDTTQHTNDEDKVNEDKVNEDKIEEDKIKEESIKILEKEEEKPIIKADLQERVEHVKIEDENLPALQNKQDLNLTKKNEEINNCKIEAVLKIIPVLEKNIQTLTKKVSCLSGLINMKQLNAKLETEQNIILNNSNLNSPNPVNILNDIEDTTTPKKKDITIGKVSKKNKKTTKNKLSVTKKKKPVKPETNLTETINENDQVTNPENSVQNNGSKSIDQLSNYLDGRLECFFTKIQSALSQIKIDKINEKCEIMVHLSGLDNKMNTNEINIDKLMANVQQLSIKTQQEIMKKQSNMKTENNKQELQKSVDDIKMCIDYLLQPNAVDERQTQQCADTPATADTNTGCTSDRCVCQLINNPNAANIEIINSSDGHNQVKYGDIILCEFLKAKLTTEMLKRSDHQNIEQANQFSNKIDDNKISHLSICSKRSNHVLSDCFENQIDDKKTCNTSVCSKKSNDVLNDCVGNQIEIEDNTICNTSICSERSNRVLSDCFENQIDDKKTCNTSVCSKKSNTVLNDCAGNQIDENKSNHLSVCSKKSNHLKNNCVQKQNKEQKMNHLTLCSKQSIHHFSKFVVENDTKLNQPILKKSGCEKNQICEFLSSQPIPEWIRQSQDLVASDNPGRNPPNSNINSSKLYNIERIVQDSRDKSNSDCTIYKITEKDDVPEENKKCHAYKEHTLVPCNSFNNDP